MKEDRLKALNNLGATTKVCRKVIDGRRVKSNVAFKLGLSLAKISRRFREIGGTWQTRGKIRSRQNSLLRQGRDLIK